MSRSGYSDDIEDTWQFIRWRGAVASSIKGKRGQAFLKELLDTLDSLPEKKLIRNELRNKEGEVCAIGSVMVARGLDTSKFDTHCYETIAETIGVAAPLVQEIEYINDEAWDYDNKGHTTDEYRFKQVRDWVESQIKKDG